jgi:hypothetical protein
MYPNDAKVELLVATNPKRQGTEARALYELYGRCNTVEDCLLVGMTYRMIDGDVQRGYVRVDHES